MIINEIVERKNIETVQKNFFDYFLLYHDKLFSIIKYLSYDFISGKSVEKIEGDHYNLNNLLKKNDINKIFVIITDITDIKKIYQMKDKLMFINLEFEFEYCQNDPSYYYNYLNHYINKLISFDNWCYYNCLSSLLVKIKDNNYKKIIILDDNAICNVDIHDKLKYNKDFYANYDILKFTESCFIINNIDTIIDKIINNISTILLSGVFINIFTGIQKINHIGQIFISNITKNDITPQNSNKYILQYKREYYYLSLSYENFLKDHRKYYKYLNNKTVAIIGPSPTIKKNINFDHINKQDIIVKINNSIFSDNDNVYTGNRIDVLYTLSLAQNLNQIDISFQDKKFHEYFFDLVDKKNIKFLVFSNELHSIIHNQRLSLNIYKFTQLYNKKNIPIIFLPKNIIEKHVTNARKIPSAGYGAIINLLTYNIKSLYIKGFTFFKDGHSMSYIGEEWKKKLDDKSISNNSQEIKEKMIHTLVKNSFSNNSPHNFNYEFESLKKIAKSDDRIVFDSSIKELYE